MAIRVEVDEAQDPKALELSVNDDIIAFEKWFMGQGNDILVRSEVAILKTYLWFKTHPTEVAHALAQPPVEISSEDSHG